MTATAEEIEVPAPRRTGVPLWIKDALWTEWHVWPVENRMDRAGEARTACGWVWRWTDTMRTSYHVSAAAGCFICRLWLEGEYVPRPRGRPKHLAPGLLPAKRTPGLPTKPKKRTPKPKPVRKWRPGGRGRPPKDAQVVKAPAPAVNRTPAPLSEEQEAEAQAALQAQYAEEIAWKDFTFEIGRDIRTWNCQECGRVLIEPGRWCSRACQQQCHMQDQIDTWERDGKAMARRQFLDQLYGRPRRDSIRLARPPRKPLAAILAP